MVGNSSTRADRRSAMNAGTIGCTDGAVPETRETWMCCVPACRSDVDGQLGLSAVALTFMPGRQGAVDMCTALYNSTPHASEQMQPMGSDFRSPARTEPVNVYMSFQQEKPQECLGYGDH